MPGIYIPPLFSKFGKTNKDLLSKKFDYDHTVKSVNKSPSGLSVETQGQYAGEHWRGNVKVNQKNVQGYGDLEATASTDAAQPITGNFTFKQQNGAIVKVDATTRDKDKFFSGPAVASSVEYFTNHFAGSALVRSDRYKHKVELSASSGVDGFAFGGGLALNASNGAEVLDANVGGEYTTRDGLQTYSLWSSRNLDFVNLALVTRLKGGPVIGGTVLVDVNNAGKPVTQIAVEQQLNAVTVVKAKATVPKYEYDLAIEHRLRDPRIMIGMAAKFNGNKLSSFGSAGLAADKFGVQITVGDF